MARSTQIIGRIYKIISSECDGVYIGSTTQQLNTRFNCHKRHYKMYLDGKMHYRTSFEVLKYTDAKIELIHEGLFDSKKHLEKLEGELIRTTPNAVNKVVIGRGKQEYDHQRYEANKDAILQYQQQYKDANREAINKKCTCTLCGGKYTMVNKARHMKSKKHQNATSSSESSNSSEQFETEEEDEEAVNLL